VVKSIGLFTLFLLPAALFAQNPKSAIGGESSLWAGAEVSYFNPGYSCTGNWVWNCDFDQVGIAAFADFNLTPKYGAEGEARWIHWDGLGNMVESNYLLGPRYRPYRRGPVSFWVKTLFGGGWITTPNYPEVGSLKGSYFMYAPGGTVDYRLTHRISLRADYEYQIWPSFQAPTTYSGVTPEPHNGPLTPNGFSVGVTYRFLGQ
jgi:Outer membrane protein beta-barrel domain